MGMSVLVVEDSELVHFLLVEVAVDVVGDACNDRFLGFLKILNACSLICALFFGELVLCVFCCVSASDSDKFVDSSVSI